jgi:hypothetical protein
MRQIRKSLLHLLCITSFLLCTSPLRSADPIPEKLVVLTFDDSAKSHFTIVRPLLLKYGFSATFFITEGFDFKDNKRDYMTWEEIAVLQFHGAPDTAHSWLNTPQSKFEQYMRYLAVEGYRVIALRDLDKYVDVSVKPKDPMGVIEDRKATLANQSGCHPWFDWIVTTLASA